MSGPWPNCPSPADSAHSRHLKLLGPLHSHDDPEDFDIVAGSQHVLTEGENSLE